MIRILESEDSNTGRKVKKKNRYGLWFIWAGSSNQGAATAIASSETILKVAHLIAIFKRSGSGEQETNIGSVAIVIYRCQWASNFSGPPLPFFCQRSMIYCQQRQWHWLCQWYRSLIESSNTEQSKKKKGNGFKEEEMYKGPYTPPLYFSSLLAE